jgi:integrase
LRSTPAPRDTTLTFEIAPAVIAEAHEMGRPSIALAQAIQFETGLRQSDVIGQWEPCDALGRSPYRLGKTRWTSGLVWQRLDKDLVLTMRTTKTGAPVTHALAVMPLIAAEIAHIATDKRMGPMIVSEATEMPYGPGIYAKTWRKIANAAGVPKYVWNRDTRAGAASEADEAGVEIGRIQKMVGHTTPKMTARYVRSADVAGSEKIARMRAQRRNRQSADRTWDELPHHG